MSAAHTRILVMAGGTGGHVYPGLAVAERLRECDWHVEWLGTRAGLEHRVVPAAGINLHCVAVSGLRGKGLVGWLLAPLRIGAALWQAMGVLRRARPHVVLGMGGFASGPGGLAAWLTRRPLVVHEQNAVPGLTNRLLARLADRTLEAFPGSFAAASRAQTVGNPVRASIAGVPALDATERRPIRVLVLGGSQGAAALNRLVPQALGLVAADTAVAVMHQCGPAHLEAARDAYAATAIEPRIVAFIEDMASAYAWSDLVICRAGAMTVSELAVAGRPALFVPFPFAVDDHQTANARVLADAEAALIVAEREFVPAQVAGRLTALLGDRARLARMGAAARTRAVPDATQRVARICQELAHA